MEHLGALIRKRKGLSMSGEWVEDVWAHLSFQNICLVSTVSDECIKISFFKEFNMCGMSGWAEKISEG